MNFRCVNCARVTESGSLSPSCRFCGSPVVIVGIRSEVRKSALEEAPPGVWRYRQFLPDVRGGALITLGEGGTPLLRASRLGKELGVDNLLIKDESRNPTGSFIDRGSTVLVSLAAARGLSSLSCVTTGNLGASLAAYCARAGIATNITIQPSTDRGKLYQMLAYGAQVGAGRPRPASEDSDTLLVSAANPFLLSGEKTTCFEVVQELGWAAPEAIVLPVGTGGHLSMTWSALKEMRGVGLINSTKCRLFGAGLRPTLHGIPRGVGKADQGAFTELEESEPFFANEAVKAYSGSGGGPIGTTTDDAVKATGLLARTEGIFAEPASAAAVAAIAKAVTQGEIRRDDLVVCVITGAGLKDTKAISRMAKAARKLSVRGESTLARAQIGQTKLDILRLLDAGTEYGYSIWSELAAVRTISTASVYQHLSELEEFSLVRKTAPALVAGRERLLYELTQRGRDALRLAGEMERSPRRKPADETAAHSRAGIRPDRVSAT